MPRQMPPPVEVEYLAGWMTLPEAAELLGLSRQRIFTMIREKKLKTVRRVGHKRPLYLIKEYEVNRLLLTSGKSLPVRGSS